MGYKALYRKYRPCFFEDVVGQDVIITTLQNSIKENKINHAYLFSGTRGTGKTTVAKIFAKIINCNNITNGTPCGECNICIQQNTDEIQDIIEIDAASNNGVDEIREIKSKVNLVPSVYKYKVYIIDEVHMLSIGAFNALLKTLEEPPAHVIFILATTEPQKLPVTISSRCQRFDFKKVSVENIKKRLNIICNKENIEITDESLEEISKISDGSMRDSICLLEQVSTYTNKKITIDDIYQISGNVCCEQLVNFVEMLKIKDVDNLLDFFEKIYNEGKNFEKLAEDLMIFLRNVLVCKNAPVYFSKKDINNKTIIINISKQTSEDLIIKMIKEINLLLVDMKKSSYPNILFEMFIFKIIDLDEKKSEEEKSDLTKTKVINSPEQKEKKNIKEESSKMKVNVIHNEYNNELKIDFEEEKSKPVSDYKKALINNTIALAEKNNLKQMKENWKKIQTYLIKEKYKNVATILLDSKINAVSNNHILLTYKYDSMVESHDKENELIEELIYDITETKYKIVAITESYWDEIRPYYVKLKRQNKTIELIEEFKPDKKISDKKKDLNPLIEDAINVFGEELIEMEG